MARSDNETKAPPLGRPTQARGLSDLAAQLTQIETLLSALQQRFVKYRGDNVWGAKVENLLDDIAHAEARISFLRSEIELVETLCQTSIGTQTSN